MAKKKKKKEKRKLPKKGFITNENNKKETNNLKSIIVLFLISRMVLLIFMVLKKEVSILELYDSTHYLNMAEFGYQEPMLYAFFPLYPILIKIFAFIIPSYQISGFLISNIASFLSVLLLDKMTKDKVKDNIWIIMCFIFSPILGYTSLVYTESLFILLTLLGYYLYKKDKYILSALVVGLSALTRNSGIILWGAIGLDMLYRLFIKKDIKFKNIVIFGLIGLSVSLIYPIYLYITTGDFLKFASVQTEYWHRVTGTPIHNFLCDLKVLQRGGESFLMNLITFLENWISFIFAFIIGIKIFKKDKTASIYIIVSLIAFTVTYRDIDYWMPLASISLFRYVLGLFPVYLYLSDNKKESTTKIINLVFFILSILNATYIYSGSFLG